MGRDAPEISRRKRRCEREKRTIRVEVGTVRGRIGNLLAEISVAPSEPARSSADLPRTTAENLQKRCPVETTLADVMKGPRTPTGVVCIQLRCRPQGRVAVNGGSSGGLG